MKTLSASILFSVKETRKKFKIFRSFVTFIIFTKIIASKSQITTTTDNNPPLCFTAGGYNSINYSFALISNVSTYFPIFHISTASSDYDCCYQCGTHCYLFNYNKFNGTCVLYYPTYINATVLWGMELIPKLFTTNSDYTSGYWIWTNYTPPTLNSLNLFQSANQRSTTIQLNSSFNLVSLSVITIKNTVYNVAIDNVFGEVLFYDTDWNFKYKHDNFKAYGMIVNNNEFYFSMVNQYGGIIHTDSKLTIKDVYPVNIGYYRCLAHDNLTQKIIAANWVNDTIDVFSYNLSFYGSIRIESFIKPYGVSFYGSRIFATSWSIESGNKIAVLENETLSTFYSFEICRFFASSIFIDPSGYMIITCSGKSVVLLYDSNGNFTNNSLEIENVMYASWDSKSRLVAASKTKIYIFGNFSFPTYDSNQSFSTPIVPIYSTAASRINNGTIIIATVIPVFIIFFISAYILIRKKMKLPIVPNDVSKCFFKRKTEGQSEEKPQVTPNQTIDNILPIKQLYYFKQLSVSTFRSVDSISKIEEESPRNFDIFISYSHNDSVFAHELYRLLTSFYKFKVWIDKNEIKVGENFARKIQKGIKSSKCLISLITRNYLKSESCCSEFQLGKYFKKRLLLIMLEKVSLEESHIGFHAIGIQRCNLYKHNDKILASCVSSSEFEILKQQLIKILHDEPLE